IIILIFMQTNINRRKSSASPSNYLSAHDVENSPHDEKAIETVRVYNILSQRESCFEVKTPCSKLLSPLAALKR
ncbi:MAG: hypothetical protein ACK521_09160, partial [bacterium]